jgi:hypothetical protein
MTIVLHGFPQSLQESAGLAPFQFIIHTRPLVMYGHQLLRVSLNK